MSDKMIMLKTSDGESFTTEEIVAVQSQTLKCLIDDDCADTEIPIPNVTGKIMALVIEYCKKHVVVDGESSSSSDDEALKKWDAEFIKDKDQGTIFDLILAANYLNVKSLLGFIHGVKPFEAFNFVSASFLSSLSLLLKSSVVNRERTDLPSSLRYINLVVMFKLVD